MLESLELAFVREHAESEKRIELVDDRGLVGGHTQVLPFAID